MTDDEPRRPDAPQDRLAVYAAVKKACEEIGQTNKLVGTFTVDKGAMMLMAEAVYRKLEEAAEDVEAFASHAKRNNINVDDVKLLFRKNKKIVEEIKAMEEEDEKEKQPAKRKRVDEGELGNPNS